MQHTHISAKQSLFDLKLREFWQYRDLVWLFTRRSFKVSYMQTILGPLWLFINPLLTSITYVVLFGSIAKLSTDGVPQLLFYLSGHALWTFFAGCVTSNASTFTDNANLFGKVYFPRLVMPVSSVLSKLIQFGIQMLMVLVLLIWYAGKGMVAPLWQRWFLLPLLLLQLGMLGMGVGIIISSLTTKYRDLRILVDFGVSLWMYATPVVYPLSTVSDALKQLLRWNPVTPVMELYRRLLLGVGQVDGVSLSCSILVSLAVAFTGVVIFNRIERTFMDTV